MRTRSSRFRFFTDAIASNSMPVPDMADLLTQAPTINPSHPTRRPSHHKSNSMPAGNPLDPDDSVPHARNLDSSRNHRQQSVHSHTVAEPSDLMLRNIVLGVTLLMALFMFLHAALFAGIFLVGIMAPAWRTFKCMEGRSASNVVVQLVDSDNDDADDINLRDVQADNALQNWQSYWILFALLFTFDALVVRSLFSSAIASPIHNTLVFAVLSWLSKNHAANASLLYSAFVRPAFLNVEHSVDTIATNAMVQMDRASQKMIVSVHEAIAPVVKHLEQAAAATAEQMQQKERTIHAKSRRDSNTR